MNLADKHMVLLQNIESTIVSVHDNYPSLKDTQVKKALEELIKKISRVSFWKTQNRTNSFF